MWRDSIFCQPRNWHKLWRAPENKVKQSNELIVSLSFPFSCVLFVTLELISFFCLWLFFTRQKCRRTSSLTRSCRAITTRISCYQQPTRNTTSRVADSKLVVRCRVVSLTRRHFNKPVVFVFVVLFFLFWFFSFFVSSFWLFFPEESSFPPPVAKV